MHGPINVKLDLTFTNVKLDLTFTSVKKINPAGAVGPSEVLRFTDFLTRDDTYSINRAVRLQLSIFFVMFHRKPGRFRVQVWQQLHVHELLLRQGWQYYQGQVAEVSSHIGKHAKYATPCVTVTAMARGTTAAPLALVMFADTFGWVPSHFTQ
jgi:hypothetical protein